MNKEERHLPDNVRAAVELLRFMADKLEATGNRYDIGKELILIARVIGMQV